MFGRVAKLALLAALSGGPLTGLCAPLPANTTEAIAVPPAPVLGAAQAGPGATPAPTIPSTPATPVFTPSFSIPRQQTVRISLLLPLRSDALGPAAEVVRSGFLAAQERERDPNLVVTVLETGDAPADIVSGYNAVALDNDIIVGPLSRSGVAALVQAGVVSKPTLALTQGESSGEAELALPPRMLVVGLSVEEQARQVADWARTELGGGRAFVVSTGVAWQRRAARAFSLQWKTRGQESETMELTGSGGYFDARALTQLKKRIQAERPALLFVAMDAAQARQLREAVGTETPIYGTAQLNPHALRDWQSAERMPEMNGVRLLDMPWQLQPDHPAVMVYPRLVVPADQKRSPDMERLFALGIDAYRVAREIALNRPAFDIDGVTGRLKVNFGRGGTRLQRLETRAVFKDGVVVPLGSPQ
jgi:outer membrane PBP1 activator LpoA protein